MVERAKAMAIGSSEIATASAGQGFSPCMLSLHAPIAPSPAPAACRRMTTCYRAAGTGDGRGTSHRRAEGLRLTPSWLPRMRLRAEPLRACTQEGQAASGGARRDSGTFWRGQANTGDEVGGRSITRAVSVLILQQCRLCARVRACRRSCSGVSFVSADIAKRGNERNFCTPFGRCLARRQVRLACCVQNAKIQCVVRVSCGEQFTWHMFGVDADRSHRAAQRDSVPVAVVCIVAARAAMARMRFCRGRSFSTCVCKLR